MSEVDIHFEFYRHLQNAIGNNPRRGAYTYDRVAPEYGDGIDGFADLIIFDLFYDTTQQPKQTTALPAPT